MPLLYCMYVILSAFLRQTQKFKMYISTERDWRFEKNVAIHEILLECSFVVFVAFWKKLKCVWWRNVWSGDIQATAYPFIKHFWLPKHDESHYDKISWMELFFIWCQACECNSIFSIIDNHCGLSTVFASVSIPWLCLPHSPITQSIVQKEVLAHSTYIWGVCRRECPSRVFLCVCLGYSSCCVAWMI